MKKLRTRVRAVKIDGIVFKFDEEVPYSREDCYRCTDHASRIQCHIPNALTCTADLSIARPPPPVV